MNISNEILSEITVHMKYAKYLPELQRRETWEELVTRNMEMHIRKYPHLEVEIKDAYTYVFAKKVLPSMRSMQFEVDRLSYHQIEFTIVLMHQLMIIVFLVRLCSYS